MYCFESSLVRLYRDLPSYAQTTHVSCGLARNARVGVDHVGANRLSSNSAGVVGLNRASRPRKPVPAGVRFGVRSFAREVECQVSYKNVPAEVIIPRMRYVYLDCKRVFYRFHTLSNQGMVHNPRFWTLFNSVPSPHFSILPSLPSGCPGPGVRELSRSHRPLLCSRNWCVCIIA